MKKTTPPSKRGSAKKPALPGWMPEILTNPRGKRPPEAAVAAAPKKTPRDKPAAPDKLHREVRASAPRPAPIAPSRGAGDPYAERESQRYEHPIPSREAILTFLVERGQLMNAEAIAHDLKLDQARDFDALTKRLAAMLRDGQLIQNRRGGYGVAEKLDLVPGSVLANPDGYGFLRPDAGGEDLYLSPFEMRKVLHGDRALGSIVGVDRRGRRQGAIVEVLERRSPRLVGRIVE